MHAKVSGLKEGTAYRYRLVAATDAAKKGGRKESEALAFTEPAAPRVVSSSLVGVSSTFAELQAQIDPAGAQTSYRFEYDTRAYAGEEGHGVSIPVPDGTLGSGGPTGSGVESALVHIGPLTAGTTYHFRVVAVNEDGSRDGPDETFTTQPAVHGLPDGRGYELVTPADKQGGSDMFSEAAQKAGLFVNAHDVGVPAESGGGFLLETDSSFGEFPFAFGGVYVFKRDLQQGRWDYTSLAARSLGVQTPAGNALFDPADLSRVTLNDALGAETGEEGTALTSLVGPPGAAGLCEGTGSLQQAVTAGCYIQLHKDPPVHKLGAEGPYTRFVGGSGDLGRVVLESASNATCPGVEDAAAMVKYGHVLCEWSGGYETGWAAGTVVGGCW